MSAPKRWIWLIGAWLAATVAAATVALAVVGLAGDQVADEAVSPLSVQEVEALGVPAPTTSTAAGEGTTTVTGEPPPTTTVTTAAAVPETTVPTTTVPPATTSTQPAAPTTSTTAAPPPEEPQIDSRQITGGTVVVRWTPSYVELVSASPADGFTVDVEKRGPEKVEVKFEGDGVSSEYSAEVSDGRLVVETQTEDDD